jgi:hypothetical protein
MSDRIALDVRVVTGQIERLRMQYPELAEDLELLTDTVEGETDFHKVIEQVTDEYLDAVSMKGAIADRIDGLRQRSDRFDRKADALKGMALNLMEAAGQPKVTLPVATLSIRKGVNSVVVEDLDAIPQGYRRTEVVPLKTEIKKALEAGEAIPGARLEHGPEGLSVRTK